MFKATWFSLKVAALATAVVLTFAGDSFAQRGGRGGGGGWGGGRGWGGGGRGWDGGGRGWGGWGWGYGGYGRGWGYGSYYPGWYGSDYYDGGAYYNTVPYYGDTSYYVPSSSYATSGYQSFYPPDAGYGRTNDNSASIQVRVPPNAKLIFNGKETSQTGSQRYFTTPPLEPGKTYTYEVDAIWQDANGQQVKRHRDVQVQAGQPAMVNFMGDQNQIQNSDLNRDRNSDLNRPLNQDLKRDQKQIPDIR
jgi:uncharacterized protein (TIGR03000 family)